jgi:uncharacterized protein YbjT (DUF2867 family)
MIAVMGASVYVGGRIAELLLDSGENVRALGRSTEKLAGVGAKGATALVGDAGDAAFLTAAFRWADAAFMLLPPDVRAADYRRQQDTQGEALVAAIRDRWPPARGVPQQRRRLSGQPSASRYACRFRERHSTPRT